MDGGIYLNNAATSWPKPECVAEAVAKALLARPGSAHRSGIEDFDVFDAVRKALAGRMGIEESGRIALGSNATWALNLAIQGFPLRRGDTVITTTAEHNSVLRPLYKLQKQSGISVIYVPTDTCGRVLPETWESAVEKYRPKLCVFTHASNVTGAVNDAPRLTAAAKAAGAAVLLDASQTLGFYDVRPEEWGVDMLAFTGHKYLLGPQGTGGLYVRPGLTLAPLLCGGTGIKSDLDEMPEEMPIRLEAGTGNEPSFYGLLSALRWAEENPADTDGVLALTYRLRAGLAESGAELIAPDGGRTPVVSFNVPGKSAEEVGYILSEGCGITCRSGLHCAPKIFARLGCRGTVRMSLSRFTTAAEIDETITAVREITEDC